MPLSILVGHRCLALCSSENCYASTSTNTTKVPDTIDTITSATATTSTSITQSTISPLSWTPLSPLPPVLSPLPPVLSPPLSPAHTRSPCSLRSTPRSLFPQRQPDSHSQIISWLQHVAELQKQMMERFDTLISLLSGTSEVASPLVETLKAQQQGPLSSQLSSALDESTTSEEDTQEETLLLLRSRATSEKNFAVQLVRRFFLPHELDGRNVKGLETSFLWILYI